MNPITSIVSIVLALTLFSPACAGKHPEIGAHTATHVRGLCPEKILNDVASGLTDFEKRASHYTKDEWNFVLGYAHYRHGNWREAEEFLSRSASKMQSISDHIIYYRGVAANRTGRHTEALGFLDTLQSDSVWIHESRLERARALIPLGRYAEARRVLVNYKTLANEQKAFDADRLIVQTYIDEKDASHATNHLMSLAISSDSKEKLKELGGLIDEVKKRFHNDINAWLSKPIQQYRLAENFANRSQWDEAANILEKITSNHKLEGVMLTRARWLLARCYRSIHRYDDAIRLMEGLVKDPNAGDFLDNILSTLATTYTKNNDYAKAISLREKMMDEAPPHSNTAALMAFKIAFLYMDEGKYTGAIPFWRKAISLGGSKRTEAMWYLAWCNHMSDKDAEAISIINDMMGKSGRKSGIHDRLLYWSGRLLEKMGRKDEARKNFEGVIYNHPGGYYAELSRRRLNGDKRSVTNFISVDGPQKTRDFSQVPPPDYRRAGRGPRLATGGQAGAPTYQPAGKQGPRRTGAQGQVFSSHLGRAVVFDRLGLREEAARELRASSFGTSRDMIEIASRNFAHDVVYRFTEGRHYKQLKTSWPLGDLPRPIWEGALPRAYEPLTSWLTADSEIDPMFVWAIMRNESAFKPWVISPAGAVGLMQMMPTTANRLVRENGMEEVDRRDLYRPAQNIALGIAYLKKLSRLFPSNPVAWIASYNAGEEAVGRWLKNGPTDDIEEWIEEIPYDETNLYVKKVLVSYWKYQRLYRALE